MQFTKKTRPIDNCPKCLLDKGKENPLTYRPGSTISHTCSEGHEYSDREELSNLMQQAFAKKQVVPVATVQPLDATPEASIDKTVVEAGQTLSELAPDITAPISTAGTRAIVVGPVDFVRLSGLLGHFTDSSSLFGAVFALNQALAETKELLNRAMAAKQVSGIGGGPRKIGGDAIVQVVIPERHVGPLEDIAKSNGMDLTRYMNARVEDGCDNMWFY